MTTVGGQSLPVDISRVFVLPKDADRRHAQGRRARRARSGVGRRVGKTGWQRGPDGATGSYAVTEF